MPIDPSETTPLLSATTPNTKSTSNSIFSPFRRLLLTTLVLSISFVLTATTLLYSFKIFACDEYYQNHPSNTYTSLNRGLLNGGVGGDKNCNIPEIDSITARDISIMVSATTLSGILNLITTSYLIRTKGVKFAMVCQTLFPVFRNMAQTSAMYIGGRTAILIVTATQSITILGGGAGYLLTANTYVSELVLPEERTACFGILQGVTMFGTAIGFTFGGIIFNNFGLAAPFEVTLCLLIFSTILSSLFLPYIAPTTSIESTEGKSNGIFSFLEPLKVFIPNVKKNGKGKDFGLLLLGAGMFTGVLSTAYIPVMLQLTATNQYQFGPSENGYLMSSNSLLRALFLTVLFPRIIASGRKLYTSSSKPSTPTSTPPIESIPTSISSFEPLPITQEIQEPIQLPSLTNLTHGSQFDLVFLRSSMLLDAVLTTLCFFITSGYQLYIAAAILPFASGTAAASKGVIMEMVPKQDQPNALSAIALMESLALTVTVSLFGFIFAYLSEIGKANLVFVLNGSVAVLAFCILFFVRFPDSILEDDEEVGGVVQ